MTAPAPLARIVPRAHELLAEVLSPGDLAVDLTAGNGHDTLFLHRCVGPLGRVVAFDIQPQALEKTAERLRAAGVEPVSVAVEGALPPTGVALVLGCHAELPSSLSAPPVAIIANLGYLPGGRPHVTTLPDTTVKALAAALEMLAPGGRIAVVVYVGHPGGLEEGDRVDALFAGLDSKRWQVLRMEAANRPGAPFLLAAEKFRAPAKLRKVKEIRTL